MRSVNLIPPEDRRGQSAPSRAGALSWIVVGVLGLAVLAVAGLTLLNQSIDQKESEVAALELREAEAQARASSLAAFATFEQLTDSRVQTVAALADSRFDWQRVMEELARVIPSRVWLTDLAGESGGADASGGAAAGGAAAATTGSPTLTMTGCAYGHRGVARMIAAVGDIDGVIDVEVSDSAKAGKGDSTTTAGAPPAAGDSAATGGGCRTRSFVAEFNLVATFEPVAVPAGATPATPAPPASPAPPAGSEPAPAPDAAPADDGGVGQAQQANSDGASGVKQADGKVQSAASIPSGGGG